MKKNFVERIDCGEYVEERVYTVETCTAIAVGIDDEKRQDALLVTRADEEYGSEKFEQIVFGWTMPEDDEGFAAMCEDSGAWSSDWDDLETVILPGEEEDNPRAYSAEKTYYYSVQCARLEDGCNMRERQVIEEFPADIHDQAALDAAILGIDDEANLTDYMVPLEEPYDAAEVDNLWTFALLAKAPGDSGSEIASFEIWESESRADAKGE